MSITGKILSSISFIALAIVLTLVGVWAVSNLDFDVTGDITYTAPEPETVTQDKVPYLKFSITDATAKTVSVSVNHSATMPEEITIPARVEMDGAIYTVTSIPFANYDSGESFQYVSGVSTLIMPNTITSIGGYAFLGSSIKNLYISEGITRCYNFTFSNSNYLTYNSYENARYLGSKSKPYLVLIDVIDKNLSTNKIHEDCRVIMHGAFEQSTISEIVVPNNVRHLNGASTAEIFKGCTNLTKITIGSAVEEISGYLLAYDTDYSVLTEVNILAKVPPVLEYGILILSGIISHISIKVPRDSIEAYKTATGWSYYADLITPCDF